MIYKNKIYLEIENNKVYYELNKLFSLKNNNTLELSVKTVSGRIRLIFSIFNNIEKVARSTFFVGDIKDEDCGTLISQICKTYRFDSIDVNDTFLIKIVSNDTLNDLYNLHPDGDILNEVLFTDFKDIYELLDLFTIMIMCKIKNKKIIESFKNKCFYFGYPEVKNIGAGLTSSAIGGFIDDIFEDKSMSISYKFYYICMLDLYFYRAYNPSIKSRIKKELKSIAHLRTDYLNKYEKLILC